MKQEHLTPDGWKPCTATTKECKYEDRRIADAAAFIDSSVEAVQAGKPNAIKSFFNTLFGSARNSVEESTPDVTPDTVTEPSDLDKVLQGEDGRYQVLCTGTWDKEPIAHPKKDYQLGECGVIAGELWNRNEHVKEYYMLKTDSEPDYGTHHLFN